MRPPHRLILTRVRRGASLVEMGLLLGLIAVIAIVSIDSAGTTIRTLLGSAATAVTGAGDTVASASGAAGDEVADGGGDDASGWKGVAVLDGDNVLAIDRETGTVIGTTALPGSANWLALADGEVFAAGESETYRLAPDGTGLGIDSTISVSSTGLLTDGTDLIYGEFASGAARSHRLDRTGNVLQTESLSTWRVQGVYQPIHDGAGLIGVQYQTYTTAVHGNPDLVDIVWQLADGSKMKYRVPYDGDNLYGNCGYNARGPFAMTPGPAGSFYAACRNGGSFYSNLGRVNTSDGSFVWYDRDPALGLPTAMEAHGDWLYAGYADGTLAKIDGANGATEWTRDVGSKIVDVAVDATGEVYTLDNNGAVVRTGPDMTERWTGTAPGGLELVAE